MGIKKELIDQSLHFGIGLGATLFLSLIMSLWPAALLVTVFAYGREVYQRVSNGRPWDECGDGCMLDLAFWGLGIITAFILGMII